MVEWFFLFSQSFCCSFFFKKKKPLHSITFEIRCHFFFITFWKQLMSEKVSGSCSLMSFHIKLTPCLINMNIVPDLMNSAIVKHTHTQSLIIITHFNNHQRFMFSSYCLICISLHSSNIFWLVILFKKIGCLNLK